ncbi:MAG: 4Fe-4S dicluster domain-containing protein [Coriobacteriales bacterium]|nr:4Fe-4S dicluster domain-containing protein [Coriobacteriales bacterium]
MTTYAMAIDLAHCVGCHTCAVACKLNNNLPDGLWYNRVLTEGGAYLDAAAGTYPNDLRRTFWPRSCQHCEVPACAAVCPVEAIVKREDGIVMQDNELCIGCKLCITACPYEARVFNETDPAYPVDFKFGDWDAPEHLALKVEKCTFCANRIDRGDVPACMELCPGRARYWGDIDDPASEINAYLEGRDYTKLLEDKGTGPNVYYVTK